MVPPKIVRGAGDCAGGQPKFSFSAMSMPTGSRHGLWLVHLVDANRGMLDSRESQLNVGSMIGVRCTCSKSAAKALL
jgi:hypothetical protein